MQNHKIAKKLFWIERRKLIPCQNSVEVPNVDEC